MMIRPLSHIGSLVLCMFRSISQALCGRDGEEYQIPAEVRRSMCSQGTTSAFRLLFKAKSVKPCMPHMVESPPVRGPIPRWAAGSGCPTKRLTKMKCCAWPRHRSCRHRGIFPRRKAARTCLCLPRAGETEGVGGTLRHRKWNLLRGPPQRKLKLWG